MDKQQLIAWGKKALNGILLFTAGLLAGNLILPHPSNNLLNITNVASAETLTLQQAKIGWIEESKSVILLNRQNDSIIGILDSSITVAIFSNKSASMQKDYELSKKSTPKR